MKGQLLINGIDARERYGVIIEYGGYKALVQYPSLKTVTSESWSEDDGVDTDLSSPQLDSREFDLSFIRFRTDDIKELIDTLSSKPYIEFNFVDFGLILNLRLVSQSNILNIQNVDKFTLRFAHDTPFENYTHASPVDIGVRQRGYEIDGKPLSDYGITVLDGSDAEITKSPSVKKNLITNIGSKQGAIYNGNKVVFEAKDVVLKCIIYDADIATFWRNYLAFLHDLTRDHERIFFSGKLYEEYPCYYKSSSVSEFVINQGKVWCRFSVTLVFAAFRVAGIVYLLTGEDNVLLLEEEGINCIDIENYGN